MNLTRFSSTGSGNYSATSNKNTLTNWISARKSWIDSQVTKYDISEANVDLIPNQTYSGEEITPEIVVKHTKNGVETTLEKDVDYSVEYSNNINAGWADINITGKGIYSGTITKQFGIIANVINGKTATIEPYSFAGTTLEVEIDGETRALSESLTYQWYKDDVAIADATQATYLVRDGDVGATIKAVVRGDARNVIGSITTNDCIIREGERPTGFTKTIAAWNYDYSANSEALVNASEEEGVYCYKATSGENMDSATLSGSVDAYDSAKIKWSGADLYTNGELTDQAPVIATSKTDILAWGYFPYFETVVSTKSFENLEFSAKLGGSKKGPRDWKLEYSLDGENYIDITQPYSITDNKVLEQAFDKVPLPEQCNNQEKLYIRIEACEDIAINGINTIVNQLSGDAAINDVILTGASTNVVTSLEAPSFSIENGDSLFHDDLLEIFDNNGGADVYYTINDGQPVLYDGAVSLFSTKNAKRGDTVNVNAWASFDTVESNVTSATYSFDGVDLAKFAYDTYSTEIINGAIPSNAGMYENTGRMTAYADGSTQYVPLWRDDNGSFCIAPDDGAKWSEYSGFTYKISTAGYKNITFNASAYTTQQGPRSLQLQYSLDGRSFMNIGSNIALSANGELENVFNNVELPSDCDNKSEIYVRVITKENSTFAGATLHNNSSKGNLYVNDVVIAGEDNGDYKMPFTNKSTSYFGSNGTISYKSIDNMPIKYAVFDGDNMLLQSGTLTDNSIKLAEINGFYAKEHIPYRVMTWVGEDDDSSQINSRTYYFKGSTITKFDYNSKSRTLDKYLNEDLTQATNTGGTALGTLSMMPNSTTKATLSYSDAYGVKVAWTEENPFYSTKTLDNPNGNGCWLIQTSTTGYTNVTLNLEQISSNKGPRDWGVAYSTDGSRYTYVANSNTRAISNDASLTPVETYNNLALPNSCDNQETLYIKIFINGGESVDGAELEALLKGNTGINAIELSGIEIPKAYTLKINTVLKEAPNDAQGTVPVDAVIKYNNTFYNSTNGTIELEAIEGKQNAIEVSLNGKTFKVKDKVTLNEDTELTYPIIALDYVADGFINAKDFAYIHKNVPVDKRTNLESVFANFYNYTE